MTTTGTIVRGKTAHLLLIALALGASACGKQDGAAERVMDERSKAVPLRSIASPTLARPTSGNTRAEPVPTADPAEFHFAPMVKYQIPMTNINAYYSYSSVLVGDVSGDGRDDLIGLPSDSVVHVFLQTAAGSLASPLEWRTGPWNLSGPGVGVIGDFDNDGRGELALATIDAHGGYGLAFLAPDGRGGLLRKDVAGITPPDSRWSTADVDRDGNLDIVGISSFSPRILYGDGRGGFDRVEAFPPYDMTVGAAMIRDVNTDGYGDLVVMLWGGQTSKIVVHHHDRRSGFEPAAPLLDIPPQMAHPDLAVGRFNADSHHDIAATNFEFSFVAGRRGDGTYGPTMTFAHGYFRNAPVAVDIDGDRRDDLVSVQMVPRGMSFVVHLALNRQWDGVLRDSELGESYFELDKAVPYTIGQGMAIGDLNADGCRDVVVAAAYEGLLRFDGVNCVQHAPPLPDERGFKSRR